VRLSDGFGENEQIASPPPLSLLHLDFLAACYLFEWVLSFVGLSKHFGLVANLLRVFVACQVPANALLTFFLSAEPGFREMFLQEAAIAARPKLSSRCAGS
jgi:hypothetical protein